MGFLDSPTANGGTQPMAGLTPQQIQELLDMGIDPETFMGGGMWANQNPTDVQGTIMPNVVQSTSPQVSVDAAPEVGVNPANSPAAPDPKDRGTFGNILAGLGDNLGGDSPMGKALMATGLGILGAQNTYGSTMGAVGQGGVTGLATYEAATRTDEARKIAKQKLAMELDANKLKRVENKLSFMQKLLDNGQTEDANKFLASNPDVQDYISSVGGGVVFKGKQDKPIIHFNDATGEVQKADPLTGETTLVGKYTPNPRQPVDTSVGAYNAEWVNTPGLPNYNPAYPTGATLGGRFDKNGNLVNIVGAQQEKGMVMGIDEDGKPYVTTGGAKMPPKAINDAVKDYRRANETLWTVGRLEESLDQSNIGLVGDIRSMAQGTLAQLSGTVGFAAEATGMIDRATRQAAGTKFEKEFNDPKLNDTQRLSLALAFEYARTLSGPGQLTEKELEAGKEFVGNNGWLTSAAKMKDALRIIREKVNAQRDEALNIMKAGSINEIPGVNDGKSVQKLPPSPDEPPAGQPTPAPKVSSAATPAGMPRDKQTSYRNRYSELARSKNPATGKGYTEQEILAQMSSEGY